MCEHDLVKVVVRGHVGVHGGQCAEPSQETLWSRLVAPTGTNRHPRISISVAGGFFLKGACLGVLGVNLVCY